MFAFAFNMVMAYVCTSVAIGCLILHWKKKDEGRKDACVALSDACHAVLVDAAGGSSSLMGNN